MVWYQAKIRIEAILWTGWLESLWPQEWIDFFGRSPLSKIKADWVGDADNGGYQTFLFVNNLSWKPLPDGWYITKTPTTNGSSFRYEMVDPEVFERRWELDTDATS